MEYVKFALDSWGNLIQETRSLGSSGGVGVNLQREERLQKANESAELFKVLCVSFSPCRSLVSLN